MSPYLGPLFVVWRGEGERGSFSETREGAVTMAIVTCNHNTFNNQIVVTSPPATAAGLH